ncbi:MAG: hypothetical protein IVW54_20290 [Candidatus Binataceae bacterium]|nr:hypothetical protein [Candidatus Binataceae bacterium]
MAQKPQRKRKAEVPAETSQPIALELTWLRAAYAFHTFTYRDPRSPQSSAPGLPVPSPTAVLLGIASTLFNLGRPDEARAFLEHAHVCQVVIDPPTSAVFFRAFHQLRRYETDKYGSNPRLGLTAINQGIREHALIEGSINVFVGVPSAFDEPVTVALRNRDHFGTRDSLCSLIGDVETCSEPTDIGFLAPEQWQTRPPSTRGVSIVTLARFRGPLKPAVGDRWWMAGGPETELAPFLIQGRFTGTSRGKIFRKTESAERP